MEALSAIVLLVVAVGAVCQVLSGVGFALVTSPLLVLALGTALSMALVSSAFGYAITRGPVLRRMLAFAPAMGVTTLLFGAWYVLGALGAVPYSL